MSEKPKDPWKLLDKYSALAGQARKLLHNSGKKLTRTDKKNLTKLLDQLAGIPAHERAYEPPRNSLHRTDDPHFLEAREIYPSAIEH